MILIQFNNKEMKMFIYIIDIQRKRLVFIHLIMTGDFHVAKWCPKLMSARCHGCLPDTKFLQIFNIQYGKPYKYQTIVELSSLFDDILWYYLLYSNYEYIIYFSNQIKILSLSFEIKSVSLYDRKRSNIDVFQMIRFHVFTPKAR